MTRILRHHDSRREDDGAVDWTVTSVVSRPQTRERREMDASRMAGSSSLRKYSDGFILYVRAFQGHSGGTKVNPFLSWDPWR